MLEERHPNPSGSTAGRTPIKELAFSLNTLCKGTHFVPSEEDLAEFTKLLDPEGSGSFEFSTLLVLVAEKIHRKEKREKGKNKSDKYALRPRQCLKKPHRMRFYD